MNQHTYNNLQRTILPWAIGPIRCPPLARVFLLVPLLLTSQVVLNGCARRPDLLPVKSPGQPDNITGFCKVVDNATKVVISVKNQGNADAPASTTTVEFLPGGSFPLPTPAIPSGGTVNLPPLAIPAGCFNPDCNFKITVDSGNQINESNEENNTARIAINLRETIRPRNDDFADRIALKGRAILTHGNNNGAGKEIGEPDHANVSGGTSVWWSWTATANGKVVITTLGSRFDTVLAVYRGDALDSLTSVAFNDDAPRGVRTSRVDFNAVKGVTYQIVVDGYRGASGSIKLSINQ